VASLKKHVSKYGGIDVQTGLSGLIFFALTCFWGVGLDLDLDLNLDVDLDVDHPAPYELLNTGFLFHVQVHLHVQVWVEG